MKSVRRRFWRVGLVGALMIYGRWCFICLCRTTVRCRFPVRCCRLVWCDWRVVLTRSRLNVCVFMRIRLWYCRNRLMIRVLMRLRKLNCRARPTLMNVPKVTNRLCVLTVSVWIRTRRCRKKVRCRLSRICLSVISRLWLVSAGRTRWRAP